MGFMNSSNGNILDNTANILDLTNGRYFGRIFHKYQHKIEEIIREITSRELYLTLSMELKQTIIHKKCEGFYKY